MAALTPALSLLALFALPAAPVFGQPAAATLEPASRTPFATDCRCGLGRQPSGFEPSGLVWDGAHTLYAVSDSGQIVRRAVAAEGAAEDAAWSCLYVWCGDGKADPQAKAENDFESVALVPGAPFARYLWIGVEGGEYSGPDQKKHRLMPRIRKFDLQLGRFVDAYWNLGGVPFGKGSGVEAMTFVPGERVPGQRPSVAGGQNLGGLFLVASQNGRGEAHLYDLDGTSQLDPAGGGRYISPVGPPFFLPGADGAARREVSSDFYYSPESCALYVAYDDESDAVTLDADHHARVVAGRQSVALYAARPDGSFARAQELALPAGRGLEAVTAVAAGPGRVALYTAVDMSGGQNPGEFAAAAGAGRTFAKKKDLKAAKGRPLPNTLDRYAPFARPAFCPPR